MKLKFLFSEIGNFRVIGIVNFNHLGLRDSKNITPLHILLFCSTAVLVSNLSFFLLVAH